MASAKSEPAPKKFEDLLARLEEIVGDMESADLPLEKLIANYEEGMKLVKDCGDRLTDAEQKVEILSRSAPALSASPVSAEVSAPLAEGASDTKLSPAPEGEEEIRLI